MYRASNDSIVRVDSPPGKEELTDGDVEAATRAATEVDETRFELIDHIVEQFGGERAILGRDLDIYGSLVGPFGGDMAHQLMLSHTSPDEIVKLYPAALAKNRAILSGYAKRGVDIAMQGYDFGMNSGGMTRPDIIRDLFFPLQRTVVEESERAGMPVFFHCCGRIWDILDDFVAAGYTGYQSIQESAGMSSGEVKARYGDVLTLWTGIRCETLIQATVQETEAEVRHSLEILMPGGGFIFGSTNSVQYGAQTENYLRALDAVRRYGRYA